MSLHREEITREIERYGYVFPVPYELSANLKLLNEMLAEVARLEAVVSPVSETHELNPFWDTASPERMREALQFQGSMTKVLLEEQNKAWGLKP